MINWFCIQIIKFYKKYISSNLRSRCIFTPSCSTYAIEALEKHNFFVAFFLIVWRLLRCNPLNKGGYDPVPDNLNQIKWLI